MSRDVAQTERIIRRCKWVLHASSFKMAKRKLSEAENLQVIGMSNSDRSTQNTDNNFEVQHSILVRLLYKYRRTERS